MNLSDTFYVALCMTVLILGVVYWFWTQNQYIQRKLNLLENIVFEMKTQIGNLASDGLSSRDLPYIPTGPGTGGVVTGHSDMPMGLTPAVYAPAPSSVMGDDEDLLHEELHTEASEVDAEDIDTHVASPVSVHDAGNDVASDSLQPGGVGSGVTEQVAPDSAAKGNVLDSMTLKELRRLAEQRSIPNASSMRKQALIDAVRALPAVIAPFDAGESTLNMS